MQIDQEFGFAVDFATAEKAAAVLVCPSVHGVKNVCVGVWGKRKFVLFLPNIRTSIEKRNSFKILKSYFSFSFAHTLCIRLFDQLF